MEYALNILEMVAVLHERGYERLRIVPGMSASGIYWRCGVTHMDNINPDHGAEATEFWEDVAHYTSATENHYFEWEDAEDDDPAQLADKFIERFPDIVKLGRGSDPDYTTWYQTMLDGARIGALPIAYDDYGEEDDPRWLPTTMGFDSGLPMPPLPPDSDPQR